MCSDRTRRNGFKPKDGRLRLDIKKKLLNVHKVRFWKMLPRKVLDTPTLEVFKA